MNTDLKYLIHLIQCWSVLQFTNHDFPAFWLLSQFYVIPCDILEGLIY